MDAGKKYLFVADPVNQWDFAEKIVDAFLRKAFLTNSILFLLMDRTSEAQNFHNYTLRKIFGGGCSIVLLNADEVNLAVALPQVDFTILQTEDEFAPIGFIETHGRKFTQRFAKTCDDLFSAVPTPAEISAIRKNLSALVEGNLLAKVPPNEFEYFLFHEGLGESTSFFFWLKKYRAHAKKKICCICSHPLRAELLMACPYVDLVLTTDAITFNFISVYFAEKYNIKRFLLMHHSVETFKNQRECAEKKESYGLIERVRDFLRIRRDVPFEKYFVNMPTPQVESAKKNFHDMNLTEGKVVFVIMEANYFHGLSEIHADFWLKLRDKLNSVGYEVITNGPKEDIPNCRNVFLSLFQSAAFAGLCGHIVSIPTGFVESICAVNMVDKITLELIHPADNDKYWKAYTRNVDGLIEGYAKMLDRFISENIDCTYRKFGNDSAEDDALIEKIVEKILR